MSLIVLVFWDGLTLSFYVYRASVRPKGSLAAWIPCGPGLVRGVKPTKSMDPTFSNRIRHIRHVQLYISNHINLSQLSWKIRRWALGDSENWQSSGGWKPFTAGPRRVTFTSQTQAPGGFSILSQRHPEDLPTQKHPRQLQPPRIFCTEKCP